LVRVGPCPVPRFAVRGPAAGRRAAENWAAISSLLVLLAVLQDFGAPGAGKSLEVAEGNQLSL
jgi:hypothetical protein